MTPKESRELKSHWHATAKILKANTPDTSLKDFESIELAARQHLLDTVGPTMAEVFFAQTAQKEVESNDR